MTIFPPATELWLGESALWAKPPMPEYERWRQTYFQAWHILNFVVSHLSKQHPGSSGWPGMVVSWWLGVYSILKSTLDRSIACSYSDITAASHELSLTDPWLFTDPTAHEIYKHQGRLGELEEDIRTYVMNAGMQTEEELEAKFEFWRLLSEGRIIPGDCFGYLSPHPTTYHAVVEGELRIVGRCISFYPTDDIVFEPWLARLAHPGIDGPVRVGQTFQTTTKLCLCCDVFPDICIHCDITRGTLRQILNYRNNKK